MAENSNCLVAIMTFLPEMS